MVRTRGLEPRKLQNLTLARLPVPLSALKSKYYMTFVIRMFFSKVTIL